MKILLAILLCPVLIASQCFAIDGGPWGGGGQVNVVGTYAGVVKPKSPPIDMPVGCSANSLGVFSIGVPTSGLSTGTFVMFAQGRVFNGTITGTADAGRSRLSAVLNATLDFTVTDAFGDTISVTATANGSANARITAGQAELGTTSTRLKGSASIDISHGEVDSDLIPIVSCAMTLRVSGFKQTDTAPTTVGSG